MSKRFMNVVVGGVNSSTTNRGQLDLMYSRMYIININLTTKLIKRSERTVDDDRDGN